MEVSATSRRPHYADLVAVIAADVASIIPHISRHGFASLSRTSITGSSKGCSDSQLDTTDQPRVGEGPAMRTHCFAVAVVNAAGTPPKAMGRSIRCTLQLADRGLSVHPCEDLVVMGGV
jgi:hypothetical protein